MSEPIRKSVFKAKISIISLFFFSTGFILYYAFIFPFVYLVALWMGLICYWMFLDIGWLAISTPNCQRLLLFYAIVQDFIAVFSLIGLLVFLFVYASVDFHTNDNGVLIMSIHSVLELIQTILSVISSVYVYRLYKQQKQYQELKISDVYVVNSYNNDGINDVTDKFPIQSLYPDLGNQGTNMTHV